MTTGTVITAFGTILVRPENESFSNRSRRRSSGNKLSEEKYMSRPQIQPNQPDLLCLSHLRWNFVFQRPQHLMSRFAGERRVFFVEEPIFDSQRPQLKIRRDGHVRVVVPHLPDGMPPQAVNETLRD